MDFPVTYKLSTNQNFLRFPHHYLVNIVSEAVDSICMCIQVYSSVQKCFRSGDSKVE